MQLLVAVKKRWTWIVRREIHFDLLPGGYDDYILPDARRWFAGECRQFERVPVQVDRVRLIALVIEAETIPLMGADLNGIGLGE